MTLALAFVSFVQTIQMVLLGLNIINATTIPYIMNNSRALLDKLDIFSLQLLFMFGIDRRIRRKTRVRRRRSTFFGWRGEGQIYD